MVVIINSEENGVFIPKGTLGAIVTSDLELLAAQ